MLTQFRRAFAALLLTFSTHALAQRQPEAVGQSQYIALSALPGTSFTLGSNGAITVAFVATSLAADYLTGISMSITDGACSIDCPFVSARDPDISGADGFRQSLQLNATFAVPVLPVGVNTTRSFDVRVVGRGIVDPRATLRGGKHVPLDTSLQQIGPFPVSWQETFTIIINGNGPVPPTNTPVPSTNTPIPPTATPIPSTATLIPPSATSAPPTATPTPPSATPRPPTATPRPPTATPRPPTATPLPGAPTATSSPSGPTPTSPALPPSATPGGPTPTLRPTVIGTPAPSPTAFAVTSRRFMPFAFQPYFDEVEDNDTSQIAQPIDEFQVVRATVGDDWDFYRVTVPTTRALSVHIDGLPASFNGGGELRLFSSTQQVVENKRAFVAPWQLDFAELPPGVYFVTLYSDPGKRGATLTPYTLRVAIR